MSGPTPPPGTTGSAGTPGATALAPPVWVRGETWRIVASMTVTCAAGAAILGSVYLATERYADAARQRNERAAVSELLSLGSGAAVREIRQYLAADGHAVIYRAAEPARAGPVEGATEGAGEAPATSRELVFALDGALLRSGKVATDAPVKGLRPLGRVFAASQGSAPAGFVVEGESRGYKNRIRFFVALDGAWNVAGVRVVEHEEDPGLGAEVATDWFQGQYVGRGLSEVSRLDVTKDPMPEDWRGALRLRRTTEPAAWLERFGALRERESDHPIYAVTGATISSRALTDGVRATVLHFRRRWELLEPHLRGAGEGE